MIYNQVCSCGTVIRENGSEKFEDSGVLHFKRAHAEEWNHMQIIKDDAQIEFKMLRDKYPELSFGFSTFEVGLKKLLSKTRTG